MPSPYERKMQAAIKEAERRVKEINLPPSRVRLSDLDRFQLSINATVPDIREFWKRRHVKLTTIMSTFVNRVIVMDDQPLAVTSPFSFGLTFHIIVLYDPANPNGPRLELLVRESDGYIIGWRVKTALTTNEPGGWYVFKDLVDDDLPGFLGNYTRTAYSQHYSGLNSVQFGAGVLPVCYEFFVTFTDPLSLSLHGVQMIETILVLCGEGQRFAAVQAFISEHYTDELWKSLKQELINLIQDWGKLSKAVLHLILAMLEQSVAPRFYKKTLAEAEDLWDIVQRNHASLNLHGPDGDYELTRLAGSVLLVLKHDPVLVTKIIMRHQGFTNKFMSDVIESAGGLPVEQSRVYHNQWMILIMVC